MWSCQKADDFHTMFEILEIALNHFIVTRSVHTELTTFLMSAAGADRDTPSPFDSPVLDQSLLKWPYRWWITWNNELSHIICLQKVFHLGNGNYLQFRCPTTTAKCKKKKSAVNKSPRLGPGNQSLGRDVILMFSEIQIKNSMQKQMCPTKFLIEKFTSKAGKSNKNFKPFQCFVNWAILTGNQTYVLSMFCILLRPKTFSMSGSVYMKNGHVHNNLW